MSVVLELQGSLRPTFSAVKIVVQLANFQICFQAKCTYIISAIPGLCPVVIEDHF